MEEDVARRKLILGVNHHTILCVVNPLFFFLKIEGVVVFMVRNAAEGRVLSGVEEMID